MATSFQCRGVSPEKMQNWADIFGNRLARGRTRRKGKLGHCAKRNESIRKQVKKEQCLYTLKLFRRRRFSPVLVCLRFGSNFGARQFGKHCEASLGRVFPTKNVRRGKR